MLAHRWTLLKWPLLQRSILKGRGVSVIIHTHTQTLKSSESQDNVTNVKYKTNKLTKTSVMSVSDTKRMWLPTRWSVFVCPWVYSTGVCSVSHELFQPAHKLREACASPPHFQLAYCCLFVGCRHRPTGASDSHTHINTHKHTPTGCLLCPFYTTI